MSDSITATDAYELVSQGAFLLDVREDDEFQAGRSANAHHIRLSELPDTVDTLPREQTIVCVCRSGGRSARAAAFLAEQGFETLNLEGGMTAWHAAELPMVSDDGEPFVA